jgi:aminopeptidase N
MKFVFVLTLFGFCFTAGGQITNCKQHYAHSSRSFGTDELRSVASANFDALYYKCFFDNTPNVRFIKGSVMTKFKMLTAGTTITFDLKSNMTVDSIKFRNTLISNTRSGDGLTVNLGTTVGVGVVDSVTIFYQGAPLATDGYFATGTHAGAAMTYTLDQPYGARYWFPCKDNVQDKVDSVEITLRYPSSFTGVANGVLTAETNIGGFKNSTWRHRKPIAAYLVAFAITNFSTDNLTLNGPISNVPFKNYYFPESATSYSNSISALRNAFNIFETRFGEYPFKNEQYAQTQILSGAGGMEHQTNSFVDSWGADLLAHELMHQWWGDLVTCNTWTDIWLNEGFASYGEVLYEEGISGTAAMINEMRSRANSINSSANGTVSRADTSTIGSIFNYRLTYLKASYVAHMLRWYLGDTKFFEQCRSYLNAPSLQYSFSRTDSLKKYMEAGLTAPNNNLTEFFNDWVYGQGYPTYSIKWNQDANKNVVIKADQTTSNTAVSFYEMPIPVKLIGATKDTTVRLMHTSNGQLFYFPLSFAVTSVQFDPQAWILSKNNTTTQDAALATTGISNIVVDNSIAIGPLPATHSIQIFNPNNRLIKSIEIYNQHAQLMLRTEGNTRNIDVSKFAAGSYTVKLTDNSNKVIMKRFIKQ